MCPEKQAFVSNKFALCRFESGRITEECVEINRLLERCLKESKCLDLESLCIVSEEKVSLKGLSHEIDSKTFDKNVQNLA